MIILSIYVCCNVCFGVCVVFLEGNAPNQVDTRQKRGVLLLYIQPN